MQNYLASPKISPKGSALFSCIRKPNVFNNNLIGYTIKLKVTSKQLAYFQQEFQHFIEEAKRLPEFKDKDFSTPLLPISCEKDGSYTIKFKSKSEYVSNGETKQRKIKVFDAKTNLIDNDEEIPNGSIVKIAYTPNIFYSHENLYGISLRINAIQIIKKEVHRAKLKKARDFGFNIEA